MLVEVKVCVVVNEVVIVVLVDVVITVSQLEPTTFGGQLQLNAFGNDRAIGQNDPTQYAAAENSCLPNMVPVR